MSDLVSEARRVELYYVPPELVPDLWPRIAQTFTWTTADPPPRPAPVLRNLILAGLWHVWVAPHWCPSRYPTRFSSVIVATVEPRPRKKRVLSVWFLAGAHFGTWIDAAARTLSSFALANGCTHLVLTGRRGWMHLRYRITGYPARAVKWRQSRSAASHADDHHDDRSARHHHAAS
jgi:hypothetical protein